LHMRSTRNFCSWATAGVKVGCDQC
jgi:hypothetical protein